MTSKKSSNYGEISNQAIIDKVNKTLRQLKLPRSQVAKRIGVDQSYLQKMLTGKRPLRLDILAAIADAINVPLRDLLKTEEHEPVTAVLGPLEVPLIKPEVLLRFDPNAGETIGMEQVIDVVPVPRVPGVKAADFKGRMLVAVQLDLPKKGAPETIYVVDPRDRNVSDKESRFLCSLGTPFMPEFAVCQLSGGPDNLIAWGGEMLGPPTQIAVEAVLGKVIWKLEYYLS